MLIWGVFTTGYILGVIFTLHLMAKNDKVNSSEAIDIPVYKGYSKSAGVWENFTQLTKINYPKSKTIISDIKKPSLSVSDAQITS
jgi:hypothetical protein